MKDELKEKTVCIVGAGLSGLCAAIRLQEKFPHYAVTIYDYNADFGGTWLVNAYPGCSCDIPSHLYSLSFEPNPFWSSQYSSQEEILKYLKTLANKHGLYKVAKFRHEVQNLEWLEDRMKWKANLVELDGNRDYSLHFDFVFCGTGEYHLPKISNIFTSFQGHTMHSAEWNSEVALENKTVAVVGSGASAIQIIPSIVGKVGKLLSYQRTPAWVIGRCQFSISRCTQWVFANIPGVRRLYRTSIYLANEIQYPAFQIQGLLSHIARPIALMLGKLHLRRQVGDPQLRANLLPNYSIGCNRVCLSNDYYPALTRENVQVIRDDIIEVTHDSIVTKDRRDKIDVLILATGFQIHEYFGPMEIVGRKGENILRKWKVDGPSIYLGIVSHWMPNLFFIHGPGVKNVKSNPRGKRNLTAAQRQSFQERGNKNEKEFFVDNIFIDLDSNAGYVSIQDLGHNTGLFTIECQVNWILQMINEMERKGASAVSVNKSVEDSYMLRHHRDMRKTIWSRNDCGTYYGNSSGLITIVYPRSQVDYWLRTRNFNARNFQFFFRSED